MSTIPLGAAPIPTGEPIVAFCHDDRLLFWSAIPFSVHAGGGTVWGVEISCPRCGRSVPVLNMKSAPTPQGNAYSADQGLLDGMIALVDRWVVEGGDVGALADELDRTGDPAYKRLAAWLRENAWMGAVAGAVIAPVLTVVLTLLILNHRPTQADVTVIIEQQKAQHSTSTPVAPGKVKPGVEHPGGRLPSKLGDDPSGLPGEVPKHDRCG